MSKANKGLIMKEHSINVHLPLPYAFASSRKSAKWCVFSFVEPQTTWIGAIYANEVGAIHFKISVCDEETFHVSLSFLLLDYFTLPMAHFLVYLHLIKHLSAGTCGQGDKECVTAWFLSSSLVGSEER